MNKDRSNLPNPQRRRLLKSMTATGALVLPASVIGKEFGSDHAQVEKSTDISPGTRISPYRTPDLGITLFIGTDKPAAFRLADMIWIENLTEDPVRVSRFPRGHLFIGNKRLDLNDLFALNYPLAYGDMRRDDERHSDKGHGEILLPGQSFAADHLWSVSLDGHLLPPSHATRRDITDANPYIEQVSDDGSMFKLYAMVVNGDAFLYGGDPYELPSQHTQSGNYA